MRMVLGCVSLFVGLLAASFASFGWRTPDGFLYFLGEYARYVCTFGGFGAIIFGSMLINDFFAIRNHDLRHHALWYQETAFEEGTMFLGEFLGDEEEKESVTKKI